MIIVADYSYKQGKVIYGVVSVSDVNKIKNFLKKYNLRVAHIRRLHKRSTRLLKIKWKKFLSNVNNLLLLKELTNYKFFTNERDLVNYLKSFDSKYNIIILDNNIKANFEFAKVIYEGTVYKTKKEYIILVKFVDTLIYLKREGTLR